ncbi:MAG: SDR family oxidoreductase [Geminicoccaceae bacterium]|nr:SDR family oxidoreductase [Geminicoccaceae bacterium]
MKAIYPDLKGRTVLVTGGATGIGGAMSRAFAGQGARVGVLDIDADAGSVLAAELDDSACFFEVDLTDIDATKGAVAEVAKALGPITVLINNAANDERHDLAEVTVAYWDAAMAVNLRHQFFCAQAVIPMMREAGGGSIVNFSSIAWMGGGTRMIAYSSAKAAVMGLTRSLARELGVDGIRVNAIAPGAVITERQRRLWMSDADIDAVVSRQCLHRVLHAEAIADTALFLASDASAMITKQCIVVDAGLR